MNVGVSGALKGFCVAGLSLITTGLLAEEAPATVDAVTESLVTSGTDGNQSLTGGGADIVGTVVSLGLGLMVVVAVIFLCGWLVRRVQGLQGSNTRAMRTLAVMTVGQREKVALIEVGGKQILLGITPQSIRTLHVFEEPVLDSAGDAQPDFARRLQAMIGSGWQKDRTDNRGEAP